MNKNAKYIHISRFMAPGRMKKHSPQNSSINHFLNNFRAVAKPRAASPVQESTTNLLSVRRCSPAGVREGYHGADTAVLLLAGRQALGKRGRGGRARWWSGEEGASGAAGPVPGAARRAAGPQCFLRGPVIFVDASHNEEILPDAKDCTPGHK